jgi:hypothetical protein
MDGVSVTRVIPAPVAQVWRAFAEPKARGRSELSVGQRWRETRTTAAGAVITEELVVVAVEPERACTLALVGSVGSGHLRYQFRPLPDRDATAVTVTTEHPKYGFANRLLGFFVGGFAARTAEGALRTELDALAKGCRAQVEA